MDELLGEFIAETLETLEALSSEVVAWESDPSDRDRLDAFFRFFHTVKGSCGFLNLPRFERLSHAAEDVLAAIREGNRTPEGATITAVLAVMDRIGDLARALAERSEAPDEAEDEQLIASLTKAQAPGSGTIAVSPAHDPAEPNERKADTSPRTFEARDRSPRTIRISLSLIDQLMNGVSDMVLARNELARKLRDNVVEPDVEGSFERLSACVADMRDLVSRSRMQRVDRLFAAIPRMVRDLSQDLGKKVELVLEGGDVEMDREMIEMVLDPLTHIVRNALDHGLELPAERIAVGKPETGRIRIAARQSGNQIVIEIVDNGKGIDTTALVAKALRLGVLRENDASMMNEADRINLIFHPGLSTAKQVSAISGRGVGMDVVRNNVERIGGIVTLESSVGKGTIIQLRVPMTLTIIPGLILRCGSDQFAIPRGNVIELVFENSSMVGVESIGGAQIATIRGTRYSLIDLGHLLGQPQDAADKIKRTLMLVSSPSGKPYALRVDAVDNNEELVIRPASPQIMAAGIFAGMTLPDNGRPMLLLDPAGIAQAAELPHEVDDGMSGIRATDQEQSDYAHVIQALHFVETTGQHRLIALDIVDRIEDIPAERFGTTMHEHFVRLNDRLVRVANSLEPCSGLIKTLHLHAGDLEICYVVRDVIDIVDMPVCPELPLNRDGLSGIVSIEGQAFEVIDTHALFTALEDHHARLKRAGRGTCLVAGMLEDGWMRAILAPLLIQAGYEVRDAGTLTATEGPGPYVLLCDAEKADHKAVAGGKVPVIRLCAHPAAEDQEAEPSVYRYDRQALLTAIEDLLQRQAA